MRALIVVTGLMAVLGVAAGARAAGTLITLDQTQDGGAPKPQFMYLEPDKLRLTSPQSDMIFRGDQGKVWIVRPREHSYVELTPDSMAQMRTQMDAAMAQMQQRLASMPPAQRQQAEAMMASRGMAPNAPAGPPQITYEKAGEPEKIGDWTCTPYHIVMNGGPESDFCIARLSDLDLTREDLKPFVSFGAFMSKMGGVGAQRSPMASLDFDAMKQQIGFDGFPVQTAYRTPDGSHSIETTLVSIQHKDAPPGSFDLPAGFTRQDIGPMGGPPGPPGPSRPPGPVPPG